MESEDKFLQNKIADFEDWSIYVHENQGYLGRCVVWCRRSEVRSITELKYEEWNSLRGALFRLEQALVRVFMPNWLNFAFLGNIVPHCHGHVIPRYSQPKHFEGMIFRDDRWGQNYQTDKSFVTPPRILAEVKLRLQAEWPER